LGRPGRDTRHPTRMDLADRAVLAAPIRRLSRAPHLASPRHPKHDPAPASAPRVQKVDLS
jgi:hypothetical protein